MVEPEDIIIPSRDSRTNEDPRPEIGRTGAARALDGMHVPVRATGMPSRMPLGTGGYL
jgi:hypothetical protein